ncbi:MAG: MFS transporter [Anaerolineae bacterium]|nr:MFS transporter [Anaerolineae bacterium]
MPNPRRALTLLFLFVFVDVLGFSLILPLLPYYAATFGATAEVVGLLLGVNALAQFLSAPILGRLSDRYGRKPLLLLSLAGTVAGFLMLGLARSLTMLFASRTVDGLLGGNISLAQAYISDVTEGKERTKGFGLLGAAFGLGFIFGPALGGALAGSGTYALPALVAAGLSFLNLLGVLVWLPESLPRAERERRAREPRAAFSLRALWEALSLPCVGPLLQTQLFFSLAFTTFETVFSLFAREQLQLDAPTTSFVLTYVGVLVVLVQGVGIRLLARRFKDKELVFGGSALLALSLLAWAFTPSLPVLLAVLAPLALAAGVLRVAINTALTRSVWPEEVGGTLGLSAALGSVTRVIAPTTGGFLLGRVGPPAPGVLGALLMLWLVYYTWRRVLFVPALACPAPRGTG